MTNSIFVELLVLFSFMALICISQTARINIDVVSARQLAFLENIEKTSLNKKQTNSLNLKDNGLSIRLNQAGIFPIIIASNLTPFLIYGLKNFFEDILLIVNLLEKYLVLSLKFL
jgi:preprotein translocase subunit SecY